MYPGEICHFFAILLAYLKIFQGEAEYRKYCKTLKNHQVIPKKGGKNEEKSLVQLA